MKKRSLNMLKKDVRKEVLSFRKKLFLQKISLVAYAYMQFEKLEIHLNEYRRGCLEYDH